MPDTGTGTAPSAETIRHATAEANGIQLHYAAVGSGKLVLFLHGFPEFWYAWRDQLAELRICAVTTPPPSPPPSSNTGFQPSSRIFALSRLT